MSNIIALFPESDDRTCFDCAFYGINGRGEAFCTALLEFVHDEDYGAECAGFEQDMS